MNNLLVPSDLSVDLDSHSLRDKNITTMCKRSGSTRLPWLIWPGSVELSAASKIIYMTFEDQFVHFSIYP
jgi:hypothetical protein